MRLLLLATALLAHAACVAPPAPTDPAAARSLRVADQVAAWLDARARPTAAGVDWPVDVESAPPRTATDLYSGSAGIVLFYLEHHHATGRAASLAMAQRGAAQLWATVGDALRRSPPGLYTGTAGVAVTFAELYRTTGSATDRQRAVACVDALAASVGTDGGWGPVTDIISGTAGIGLALLRLADDLDLPRARQLARRAGDHLLAGGEAVGPHRRWPMRPGYPREMPNFSHGTAGVAYFLARLHQATGDPGYLGAARAGADYLLTLTGPDGLIHHNQTAPRLFYLGWCHGPPGTARLFALLAELTDDPRYRDWEARVAATVAGSNIPRTPAPGFWNNHGQCCGTAGVIDWYLWRRLRGGDDRFDRRIAGMLAALRDAARPAAEGPGLAWPGAEHRVRPTLIRTQTGYAQGAAGIGLLFLHHAAWRRGAPRRVVLPDAARPPAG